MSISCWPQSSRLWFLQRRRRAGSKKFRFTMWWCRTARLLKLPTPISFFSLRRRRLFPPRGGLFVRHPGRHGARGLRRCGGVQRPGRRDQRPGVVCGRRAERARALHDCRRRCQLWLLHRRRLRSEGDDTCGGTATAAVGLCGDGNSLGQSAFHVWRLANNHRLHHRPQTSRRQQVVPRHGHPQGIGSLSIGECSQTSESCRDCRSADRSCSADYTG